METSELRRLRLIELLNGAHGGKISKLAKAIERDHSYTSRLLYEPDRRHAKAIGEDMAHHIEAKHNLPKGWLDNLPLPTGVSEPPPVYGRGPLVIPVFDAPASMGKGYPAPEHDVIVGGLQLDESWVHQNLGSISSPSNLAVIPAYGDSMNPTFSDSDLLLVDRGVSDIRLDAVYVLGLNGDLYIKRLQRRPDGTLLMISDNKSYEPYRIENGDREQFSVLGRVVWAWVGKKL